MPDESGRPRHAALLASCIEPIVGQKGRPGWFTQEARVVYHLTRKGEPFRGHDVSLDSLSDLIVKLSMSPTLELRQSLGVSQA